MILYGSNKHYINESKNLFEKKTGFSDLGQKTDHNEVFTTIKISREQFSKDSDFKWVFNHHRL